MNSNTCPKTNGRNSIGGVRIAEFVDFDKNILSFSPAVLST